MRLESGVSRYSYGIVLLPRKVENGHTSVGTGGKETGCGAVHTRTRTTGPGFHTRSDKAGTDTHQYHSRHELGEDATKDSGFDEGHGDLEEHHRADGSEEFTVCLSAGEFLTIGSNWTTTGGVFVVEEGNGDWNYREGFADYT